MQGIRSKYNWRIFGGYNLSLVWKPYRLSVWKPYIIGMEIEEKSAVLFLGIYQ